MPGFEPGASCSQSRRANQAAPHPAGPNGSLPSRVRRAACTQRPRRPLRKQRHVRPRRGGTGTLAGAHPVGGSRPAWARGRSSMAEPQPSKLVMRVRFPSPAPTQPNTAGQPPCRNSGEFWSRSSSAPPCPLHARWALGRWLLLGAERRRRQEREAQEREDRHKAQARLIAASSVRKNTPGGLQELRVIDSYSRRLGGET